jgi:hypothetical protein
MSWQAQSLPKHVVLGGSQEEMKRRNQDLWQIREGIDHFSLDRWAFNVPQPAVPYLLKFGRLLSAPASRI